MLMPFSGPTSHNGLEIIQRNAGKYKILSVFYLEGIPENFLRRKRKDNSGTSD